VLTGLGLAALLDVDGAVRAYGSIGQVDAKRASGLRAELLKGELIAGQCVDPAAKAVTALVGQGEQALCRTLLGGVPLRGDKPCLLHALQSTVDAGCIGLLAAEHGRIGRLLHDDVAMHGLICLGKQGENGGLGKSIQGLSELSAFLQIFIRFRVAAAPHGRMTSFVDMSVSFICECYHYRTIGIVRICAICRWRFGGNMSETRQSEAPAPGGDAREAIFANDQVGLGVDIVEISRMRKILERTPSFAKKVFSEAERAYCDGKATPEVHYATRFAAKEAVVKALGTGFSGGIGVRDIEVRRTSKGRPYVVLTGRARELARERGVREIPISLSYTHTEAVACAMAITEDAVAAAKRRVDPMEELARQFKDARAMLDELPTAGLSDASVAEEGASLVAGAEHEPAALELDFTAGQPALEPEATKPTELDEEA